MDSVGGAGNDRERIALRGGPGEQELIEAWRTSSGSRLVIVFPDCRRFLLEPGERLPDSGEEALEQLLAGSASLTPTETWIQAPDGNRWLAQATGPVWSDGNGAEGQVGTLFTSLDGPFERFQVAGWPGSGEGPPGTGDQTPLVDLWRAGHVSTESGEE